MLRLGPLARSIVILGLLGVLTFSTLCHCDEDGDDGDRSGDFMEVESREVQPDRSRSSGARPKALPPMPIGSELERNTRLAARGRADEVPFDEVSEFEETRVANPPKMRERRRKQMRNKPKHSKNLRKLLDPNCGRAPLNNIINNNNKKISSYMINGETQHYGNWPSFVKLHIEWPIENMQSICGGTLIAPNKVLTAAHCMFNPIRPSEKARPDMVMAILGDHESRSIDRAELGVRVASMCISGMYNTTSNDDDDDDDDYGSRRQPVQEVDTKSGAINTMFDYAVLTLKRKVTYNDHIQSACMPEDEVTASSSSKLVCYLVGSGAVRMDSLRGPTMSKTVQQMRVKRVSCKNYGFGHDDKSRECYTKYGSIGDSCAGDSGGPVLCVKPHSNEWTVNALVSYGTSNCDGQSPIGWVGVYTRVSNIVDTIMDECKL